MASNFKRGDLHEHTCPICGSKHRCRNNARRPLRAACRVEHRPPTCQELTGVYCSTESIALTRGCVGEQGFPEHVAPFRAKDCTCLLWPWIHDERCPSLARQRLWLIYQRLNEIPRGRAAPEWVIRGGIEQLRDACVRAELLYLEFRARPKQKRHKRSVARMCSRARTLSGPDGVHWSRIVP